METTERAIDRMLKAALQREKPTTIVLGVCRSPSLPRNPPTSPCRENPCQYLAIAQSLPAATAAVEAHRAFERDQQWAEDMTRTAGGTGGAA
jgi:hypothetical protein